MRNLTAKLIETGDPVYPFSVYVTRKGKEVASVPVRSRIAGEAMIETINAIAQGGGFDLD